MTKARILVIDDNHSMRDAVCKLLELAGYETIGTDNGQQATEIHRAQPVDLVITDLFMPETDGLEVIFQFRQAFPEVKIIAVSGGGSRGLVELLSVAKKMGAQRALMKPFNRDELMGTVREVLADTNGTD